MRMVFLAHQIKGNVQANLASVRQWSRWAAVVRGVIPIVPYLSFMEFLDDQHPRERELGVSMCRSIIPLCDEFWIVGPVPPKGSEVWKEREIAEDSNLAVIDYAGLALPTSWKSPLIGGTQGG